MIPGTTHYDFSDTPHMSKAAKLLKKSGDLDSESLKNILNELILNFFNKNLKNIEANIDYYDFSTKYEINIIAEEYLYE